MRPSSVQAQLTEVLLLERISELWCFRKWYRKQVRWDMWMDLAFRNDEELRALVALARRARRLATPDPDPFVVEHDYRIPESELRAIYGDR